MQLKPQTPKKSKYSPPDLLAVNNKDPKFSYRWIKPHDRMNFYSGQENRGWEIVRFGTKGTEDNLELQGLFSQFAVSAAGTVIRCGDLILARMPKEKAEERNEHFAEKSRQQVKTIQNAKRNISSNMDQFTGEKVETWNSIKM